MLILATLTDRHPLSPSLMDTCAEEDEDEARRAAEKEADAAFEAKLREEEEADIEQAADEAEDEDMDDEQRAKAEAKRAQRAAARAEKRAVYKEKKRAQKDKVRPPIWLSLSPPLHHSSPLFPSFHQRKAERKRRAAGQYRRFVRPPKHLRRKPAQSSHTRRSVPRSQDPAATNPIFWGASLKTVVAEEQATIKELTEGMEEDAKFNVASVVHAALPPHPPLLRHSSHT